MSSTGRFQGVLEPSRTVGDVDVKADAPKGAIASFPEVCMTSLTLLVLPSLRGLIRGYFADAAVWVSVVGMYVCMYLQTPSL